MKPRLFQYPDTWVDRGQPGEAGGSGTGECPGTASGRSVPRRWRPRSSRPPDLGVYELHPGARSASASFDGSCHGGQHPGVHRVGLGASVMRAGEGPDSEGVDHVEGESGVPNGGGRACSPCCARPRCASCDVTRARPGSNFYGSEEGNGPRRLVNAGGLRDGSRAGVPRARPEAGRSPQRPRRRDSRSGPLAPRSGRPPGHRRALTAGAS